MTKFMCKNEHFQSSGTKIEFHAKFRDENNSFFFFFASCNAGGGGAGNCVLKKEIDNGLTTVLVFSRQLKFNYPYQGIFKFKSYSIFPYFKHKIIIKDYFFFSFFEKKEEEDITMF